ncbi:tetratricopeptide repeat protein [bacterium]|nr:tetratricopeptide repeat protein [bacterium]
MNYEQIEELQEKHPELPIFARVAENLLNQGKLQEAIGVLTAGIDRFPDYLTAKILLGKLYLNNNEPEKALDLLLPLSHKEIQNLGIIQAIAQAYFMLKDYKKGLSFLQRLYSIDFTNSELLKEISNRKREIKEGVPEEKPKPPEEKPEEKPAPEPVAKEEFHEIEVKEETIPQQPEGIEEIIPEEAIEEISEPEPEEKLTTTSDNIEGLLPTEEQGGEIPEPQQEGTFELSLEEPFEETNGKETKHEEVPEPPPEEVEGVHHLEFNGEPEKVEQIEGLIIRKSFTPPDETKTPPPKDIDEKGFRKISLEEEKEEEKPIFEEDEGIIPGLLKEEDLQEEAPPLRTEPEKKEFSPEELELTDELTVKGAEPEKDIKAGPETFSKKELEERLSDTEEATPSGLPPDNLLSPTMAEIFAGQGHTEKAIAIYEKIIDQFTGEERERYVKRIEALKKRLEEENK